MGKIAEMVYEDLVARGKSVKTARHWRNWTERFVQVCGEKDNYGRPDLIKFLAVLQGEKHKQNSINTMIRPIKLLCQIQAWPGGFPRLAMPRVRVSDINRPILTHDEIAEMIRRGKGMFIGRELAWLAFATTYGLRREELTDLKVGNGTVTVDTVKGGEVTTHIIPDEIKEYIVGYAESDVYYLTIVFNRMVKKLDMKLNGKAYGWHAIRRALATELLLLDVSALNILRFMRWSDAGLKGEFGMLVVYAQRKHEDIDRSIFAVHPFLPVWAEDNAFKV